MPRRRLGGVRQGCDQALAGRHAVCRSQRDSRSDLQRPHGAHARSCSATSVSMRSSRRCVDALQYLHRHAGGRRFLVWPLGRELHLRHLAGAARFARDRRGYDAGLDSARHAIGWRAARTKTAAGAKPAPPTRTRRSKARREHRIANGLGGDGHSAPAAISIGRVCSAVCVFCLHATARMAPGPSRKSPAPVSRACSI